MDWHALHLSLLLGVLTVACLLPVALVAGRWLAVSRTRHRALIEAALTLPLVLPPTVIGFYLLGALGPDSIAGRLWSSLTGGGTLVFSFEGILLASVLVNLPFAVQPAQRGFEAVGDELRDAAATCGHSLLQTILRVELPLAWPGIVTGAVLTFAHTLGEFGVVLMIGGAIPGVTKVASIALYDDVQALAYPQAHAFAATLLGLSFALLLVVTLLQRRRA